MTDIRQLTEEYVTAFDARDIDKVASLFAKDFILTDQEVTALTPKSDVIKYIKRLFVSHETLSFEARDIVVDGEKSVIHFTLTLDKLVLDGVDVITWKCSNMTTMTAYLKKRN